MSNKDKSFKTFLIWIWNQIPKYPIEMFGLSIFLLSMILILSGIYILLITDIPLFLYWFYMMWKEEQ